MLSNDLRPDGRAAKRQESMAVSGKLYRRLADSIAAEIEAGKYNVGERLPTERELAKQFGVSRPSLREALITREMLGMIEARHCGGIYVTCAQLPLTAATYDF